MSAAITAPMVDRPYTTKDAVRILKLSFRQLQWWDEHGVVEVPQKAHKRLYSRDDLLWLAVVAELRNKGLGLGKVRRVIGPKCRRRFAEKRDETDEIYLLTDGQETFFETPQNALRVMNLKKRAMYLVDMTAMWRHIDRAIERLVVRR